MESSQLQSIHWQLSVLSRAIHYKNLSSAASHVGVSQPQLSRIVAKLEDELGVVLLDRTARRKSGWTPVAFKVADTYFKNSRKLSQSLQQLTGEDHVHHISVGTLEGLMTMAMEFARQLFKEPKMHVIELNVYDLGELEEHFEKDELDLIFTCREPGKHKYKNVRNLGYQRIERMSGKGPGPRVLSPFDHASESNRRSSGGEGQVLLSNSLALRRHWLDEHGGSGFVPSEVRRAKSGADDVPVILMASDLLNPSLWRKIEQFRL